MKILSNHQAAVWDFSRKYAVLRRRNSLRPAVYEFQRNLALLKINNLRTQIGAVQCKRHTYNFAISRNHDPARRDRVKRLGTDNHRLNPCSITAIFCHGFRRVSGFSPQQPQTHLNMRANNAIDLPAKIKSSMQRDEAGRSPRFSGAADENRIIDLRFTNHDRTGSKMLGVINGSPVLVEKTKT